MLENILQQTISGPCETTGENGEERYQTATGEVGCGTQGSTGKQQSTKIPLGGYVPWVNDPLVPNEA